MKFGLQFCCRKLHFFYYNPKVKHGIKAHFPTAPKLKSLVVGGTCESFAQNTKCLRFKIVLTSWEGIVNTMVWTSE